MHDPNYVVELAKAYGNALITRDELQDEFHSCLIETIMYGVNVFDEDYGQEAAAAFVVAAELPICGNASLQGPSWILIQRRVGCRKAVGALIGATNA
jgi:hypothetical protein